MNACSHVVHDNLPTIGWHLSRVAPLAVGAAPLAVGPAVAAGRALGEITINTSRTKFVILFLISGFAFQFISNSLLGSEARLFPARGVSPGNRSPIAWKSAVSTLLLPIKVVLIGPLLPPAELPDLSPLFLVIAFVLCWTILALFIHYLLGRRKRS